MQNEEGRGAALSPSFPASRRERDREGSLGRNGQKGRREAGECEVSETNIDTVERANIRRNCKKLPFLPFFLLIENRQYWQAYRVQPE